jgi:hypothetical protein
VLLFDEPVGVNRNQEIEASIELKANKEQAFDTELIVKIPQINVERIGGPYDMREPEYRGCYSGYAAE